MKKILTFILGLISISIILTIIGFALYSMGFIFINLGIFYLYATIANCLAAGIIAAIVIIAAGILIAGIGSVAWILGTYIIDLFEE